MKYLILGGTGTLGKALAEKLLSSKRAEVVCLSRCELKQKQMASEFNNHPRLSFVLGDIRDKEVLMTQMRGVDTVFHVAALKHVDVLEENPEESVRTNILGTINVADAALANGVKYVVFSSTDKAVDPINVYGMSKGISEKILLRKNETQKKTRFSVYRWGNVVGSRGSAIEGFAKSLRESGNVYLTDPKMTRFWIRIEDAVDFILSSYKSAPIISACIPPIKAAPVKQVIEVIADLVGANPYKIIVTGPRRGEKLHESLLSTHSETPFISSEADQLTNEELEKMIKPIIQKYMPTTYWSEWIYPEQPKLKKRFSLVGEAT